METRKRDHIRLKICIRPDTESWGLENSAELFLQLLKSHLSPLGPQPYPVILSRFRTTAGGIRAECPPHGQMAWAQIHTLPVQLRGCEQITSLNFYFLICKMWVTSELIKIMDVVSSKRLMNVGFFFFFFLPIFLVLLFISTT